MTGAGDHTGLLGRIFKSYLSSPSTMSSGHFPNRGCAVSLSPGAKMPLSTIPVDR
jgi:hypothetical protein